MSGEQLQGSCPVCNQGDLITISMNVDGRGLSFTTCHMCEAKWWHRDGEPVPFTEIGSVISPTRS
jgi:DNA polymerase III alpha subunit (gram-positive type)